MDKAPADAAPSGTVIILFADIVDSTSLTERMGDAAFREKARALDDALRLVVRDNGGAWWEYSCHIDYVPAGMQWVAGDHPPEDSFYLWGPDVPPTFIE